jgi:hypothetical protein
MRIVLGTREWGGVYIFYPPAELGFFFAAPFTRPRVPSRTIFEYTGPA